MLVKAAPVCTPWFWYSIVNLLFSIFTLFWYVVFVSRNMLRRCFEEVVLRNVRNYFNKFICNILLLKESKLDRMQILSATRTGHAHRILTTAVMVRNGNSGMTFCHIYVLRTLCIPFYNYWIFICHWIQVNWCLALHKWYLFGRSVTSIMFNRGDGRREGRISRKPNASII